MPSTENANTKKNDGFLLFCKWKSGFIFCGERKIGIQTDERTAQRAPGMYDTISYRTGPALNMMYLNFQKIEISQSRYQKMPSHNRRFHSFVQNQITIHVNERDVMGSLCCT